MRPISLVIDGINSFSERQTVDFDFDGLFCISGDTGSGKTTILDCIILALYGSGKHASSIGDYVNLKRDKAEIRFVFETATDGERRRYEVYRSLTRDGIKGSRLIDLTSGLTIAEQSNNVTAAIAEMIGLKKDDFTQVVILEQGKFAKFLTATKKERNETVGNLFKLYKYKDLGSKVKKFVDSVKKDVDYLSERIDDLAEVTAAAVRSSEKELAEIKRNTELTEARIAACASETARLSEAARRFEECRLAAEKAKELRKKQSDLEDRSTEIRARLAASDKALGDLNDRKAKLDVEAERMSGIAAISNELGKRNEELAKLRAEWTEAEKICGNYRRELSECVEKERNVRSTLETTVSDILRIAKLGENGGYSDVFDLKSRADKLVDRYLAAQKDYVDLDKKVQDLTRRVKTDTDNLARAFELVAAAERRRNALRDELADLRSKREIEIRDQAADLIREGLKVGDVCPVCGETVRNELHASGHADSAEKLATVEAEFARVDAEYNTLGNNRHSLATRLDESRKLLDEANEALAASAERLETERESISDPERIDELPQLTGRACLYFNQLNALENGRAVTEEKLRAAFARADDVRARGERERAEADRLQQVLEEKRGTYDDITVSQDDAERLKNEIARETELNEGYRKELEDISGELRSALAMAEHFEAEAIKTPEFDPEALSAVEAEGKRLGDERARLIAEAASLDTRTSAMKSDLERKRGFEAERAERRKKLDVYADIYKLVSGDKFIEYVAEEYILQFTEAASAVLCDITGGKYTLEYSGGSYYVRDFLSDGMLRKASTLSGGETFLASLALAIAISREIARYKSYEFFFLDEGFGTLDAGSIETVVDALESLSRDTLVGVVTHRTELTERIFDKIVVTAASEGRGSIITRSN